MISGFFHCPNLTNGQKANKTLNILTGQMRYRVGWRIKAPSINRRLLA
jgi:phage host-nuclease inhibitor protein Gam